ncbi:MAG: oligopeptide/dipeptide ABC transporter ATP-binding protein [Candidatus Pelethousia sp.]|nr:oligopeptide/dipeptide ABC transporter ATP-binding protein [Candidatus Pelethousia sp.]
METLLEVKHLKKHFNTKSGLLHAVDDISFTLEKGKTLGVVGESGCGKSTLGRVILHLLEATEGQILFKGQDISKPGKRELHHLRRNMQMVFQDPFSSLNPRFSVAEIIGEPLLIYKACKTKEKYRDRVRNIMETVGLPERYENVYPHELDGGRRQRIGLGRALALNPEFIICDEPVSALDVSIQAQILNLLQDLQAKRNLTYIFVTHDLSVVKHISDEIMVMYLGVMVEKCPSADLFAKQLHPYTKALLSAIPQAKLDIKRDRILLRGELTSPINPAPICRFAARCNYACDACLQKQPPLEEVLPGHFVACHRVREINDL